VHDKQVRRRRAVLGVLVGASLVLLTAYFGASPSSPLHEIQRGIVEVFSPIQQGASKVLSPVRDVAGWFSSTLKAKSQVTALDAEVARLQTQLAGYREALIENQQYRSVLHLDVSNGLSAYHPVTATVYARDPQLWYQTIEVDKGTDDGVQANDPVIGGTGINKGGLVGKVLYPEQTVSVVLLITDPTFGVDAKVESGGGYDGTLVPETGDPTQMVMEYLQPSADIQPNQMVVTSGVKDPADPMLNSLYPPGIPIGTVSGTFSQANLVNNQEVPVTPLVDLRQLSTVQILTRPEGNTLSASAPTNQVAQVTPQGAQAQATTQGAQATTQGTQASGG
jgi:rod shape-determining protein MreC